MVTVALTSRALSAPSVALPGVGRALVLAGALRQQAAEDAYRAAQASQRGFVALLIESGMVPAAVLAQVMSQAFTAPLIDVDALDPRQLPTQLIEPRLASTYRVLALGKRQGRVVVVTADPTNHEAAEKIKFATQAGIDWVIAEFDKLARLVETVVKLSQQEMDELIGDIEFDEAALGAVGASGEDQAHQPDIDDAPIVRFLHKMLRDAVLMDASDLHFEPYEHHYRVRFRIDGQLHDVVSPPLAIKDKLASRIKVISRLDIAEKRLPQDGRMKLRLGPDRVLDCRVSTLPTLFGEKIVIRVLDSSGLKLGLDALGYEPEEKARLLAAIGRPYGMVLVTGPTGSGKTLSLYTCLNLLNQPGVNIATVEDPSEINLPGVNQVNINEKAGLSFAVALRAFLRQDPDIIMVGEIRDLETADIAIKAAQTGHLVLATVHTNDAPSTLTRLRNMGVAPFHIASGVILISAQRLARRLCAQCKAPAPLPRAALIDAGFAPEALDGGWTPYKPVGCDACHQGYKGRIGIYEVMPVSEAIQRLILADGSTAQIAAQARREGMRTLREAGLHKVRQGITSLEEILSLTNQ